MLRFFTLNVDFTLHEFERKAQDSCRVSKSGEENGLPGRLTEYAT
jgi:hypothetical protein